MLSAEKLPVKRSLLNDFRASIILAIIIAASSIVGLAFSSEIYPTVELLKAFASNDVINLLIGLPVLLLSIWLTRRGKWVGLLFWPGAMLYMVYNYLIYLVAMPLNAYYVVFPVLVLGSVLILIRLLLNFDGEGIQDRLVGKVPEKFGGGVMVVFGVFFIARVTGLVFQAAANQEAIAVTEIGLHIADVLLSVILVVGGVQLWRKRVFGYMVGLGLLFQASMLFIGLIAVFLLQPLFVGGDILWMDILFVFLMGFVTFIPLAMFIRGVSKAG
jgi:hypothetical protein